jgi:TrmH family RNA methyltransferase
MGAERSVDAVLEDAVASARPVLIGVGLADPGNLGTIARASEAAGAAGLVLVDDTVDLYNPKVIRAAAGALFRLPVSVGHSATEVLDRCGELGILSFAAAADSGDGTTIPHWDAPLHGCCAIVVGSEAHGLDPSVIVKANESISISHDGPTESLNVAMAATLLLFEAFRQRRNG